jgi:hypothetical protein
MPLTDALAIYGAATATASAVTQGVVVWRNRPRLRVGMGFETGIGKQPTSHIDVFNIGPLATTVREVGYYATRTGFQVGQGDKALAGRGELTFKVNEGPFFLEAGDSRRFYGPPAAIDYGVHADFPLRVYAIDARGRRVWGVAGPVTRWLVGDDPPIHEGDPDGLKALVQASPEPLYPERVEPRWKLWKPRELRNPKAYRPERRPPKRLRVG